MLRRIIVGVVLLGCGWCQAQGVVIKSTDQSRTSEKPVWRHRDVDSLVSLQEMRIVLMDFEKYLRDVGSGSMEAITFLKHKVFEYRQIKRYMAVKHANNKNISGTLREFDGIIILVEKITSQEQALQQLRQNIVENFQLAEDIKENAARLARSVSQGKKARYAVAMALQVDGALLRDQLRAVMSDKSMLGSHIRSVEAAAQSLVGHLQTIKSRQTDPVLVSRLRADIKTLSAGVHAQQPQYQHFFETKETIARAASQADKLQTDIRALVQWYMLTRKLD